MSYDKKVTFYIVVTLLAVGLVALAGLGPRPVQAEGLPPRETATPRPGNEDKEDKDGPPAGAYLELVAPNIAAGAWATVQWQDASGGWHDVEGWRGRAVDSSRWWVHPRDFSTGPFRWLVTQEPGGPPVGTSAPFTLPGGAGQIIWVTVP